MAGDAGGGQGMMGNFLGRECPTCGHTLRLAVVGGRIVWVCLLCGTVRR